METDVISDGFGACEMSCVKDFVFSGTTGTLYLVHVYVYRVYSFDAAHRARANATRRREDVHRGFPPGSGRRHGTTPQMSLAYSRMVLSLLNLPELAVDLMLILVHLAWSLYV